MAKSNRELLITLGADTTTFSQKVKRAKDLTKELDSNFKLLSSSSKNFESSLDGLGKKQEYLNDRIKVATTLNDVYNERLKDQQDRLNKSTESMGKLQKELEELKDVQKRSLDPKEWDAWQKEIDSCEDELKQITKETKSFQDSVIGLNTLIDKNQSEVQKMNGELTETKLKFDILSRDNTFKKMKDDIEESNREFNNIKNSTNGFGNALSDLKAENAQYNIQMQKTTALMNEYQRDIDKSTKEMKQMETVTNSLTSEVREMQVAVDKMDGTEKHYKEWSDELDRLRAELTSSNRVLEIHKTRVETLTKSYKESENSLASLKGSVKRVDDEIYKFGKKNNFKEIQTHIESLKHEFDSFESQMELLRSKYISFETSISGAIREKKLLKQETKNLKEQFKAQTSAMNEYKLKLKELTTEKTKLKTKIDEVKKSLEGVDEKSPTFVKTNSALGELERNLEKVENEMEDVNKELRQMELESNSTLTSINNNIQGQGRVWDTVSGRMKAVGGALTSAGNSMQSLGGSLMPVTMGVTALGGAVIKTGMDFQEGMDKATSVMGANEEQTQRLIDKARSLASESRWTATEVSQAYGYMGMAGWDAEESLTAVNGVMLLASAGATDLAKTSDIVTDGLTAMQLGADSTTQFVDVMSATMVGSNTNIELLGETMKYAGNVAGGLGINMEDLSLAIGTMANAGIKGSMSGTALRGGLTRLIAPTEKGAKLMKKYGIEVKKTDDGNVDLRATMENLQKTMGDLDKDTQNMVAKQIFGQTAMNGWLSIINADSEKFKELAENIDKASASNGEFTRMLEKQMNDNLAGDLRTLKSTIEETFLTVFDEIEEPLRNFVQNFTQGIKDVTKWFKGLDDATQMNIVKFVAFAGVVAPLISLFGFLLSGVGSTISVFGGLVGGTGKVITKFGLLKQNGIKLSGVFTDFRGTAGKVASTLSGQVSGATAGATGKFSLLKTGLGALSKVALPAMAVALGAVVVSLGENENALTWLADKWGWFGEKIGSILERLMGGCQLVFGNLGIMLKMLGEVMVKVISGQWNEIDDVFEKGMADMSANTSKAMSNLNGESAKAISHLRKVTTKDIKEIGDVFTETFELLPTVTSRNVGEVAKTMADMFDTTNRGVLSISETNLEVLRGTSDTMSVLFSGMTAEMDITDATRTFEYNLNALLQSGMITTEELEKDFKKAGELIEKNLVDGLIRTKENGGRVLKEFADVASGNIDSGVEDIVGILQDLGDRGTEELRGMGTNWNAIFGDITNVSKMSAEDIKTAILNNLDRLGLDTPEKLAEFKKTLGYELDLATEQARTDGTELGGELLDGVETGVNEGKEETGENIKNATKEVTEKATQGAKEGFEQLPDSVKQELEKAGVSINEQGNVIVTDMGKKGREGAKAYVDEMNAELPKISGVAGTIQEQLNGINTVKFGGVTKQLSEVNRWLGDCTDSAVKVGASLTGITTVSFGGTTKGLSEINKHLKDNITVSAKNVKTALTDITKVTYGSTTKGLSEVNKWLKEKITPSAVESHGKLLTLSKFTFSGVISGLKSVNSWLNTIKSTAGTTKNALQSVANAKASIQSVEGEPIPENGMESYNVSRLTRDSIKDTNISNFKTNGGFYEPQSIKLANPSAVSSIGNSDALLKATLEQNQLLLQLLNQQKPVEVAVNMDGRQVAKASAKYMQSEIGLINARKSRLGGK